MDKIVHIYRNCKVVSSYNIVPMKYARVIECSDVCKAIIGFNTMCISIILFVISDKRLIRYEQFSDIVG